LRSPLVVGGARHPHARLVRHEHDEAARDRHVRGETRALVANRILDDLHDDRFAFAHAFRDAGLVHEARQVGEAACFARGEEACFVQTQIDEGRLHAGQYALHAAEHDVAEQTMAVAAFAAALRGTLDKEFAEARLIDECDPRFGGADIDQNFGSQVRTKSVSCDWPHLSRFKPPRAL
jgi:hypothetical protein